MQHDPLDPFYDGDADETVIVYDDDFEDDYSGFEWRDV